MSLDGWRLTTALVIVGAVVLLILYDLVAYALRGSEATISRLCYETAAVNPGFALAFAFAFGVLCGHLFLPQHVSE